MRRLSLLLALGGLLSFTSAQAQMIGIGVQFTQGGGTAIAPTDTAGVVPISNYNVVTGAGDTATGYNNPTGSATGLNDNNNVLTTLSLNYAYAYGSGGSGNGSGGNQSLYSSGISLSGNGGNTATTLTLSGIPYASYDIYVFTSENGNYSDGNYYRYSVSDGSTTDYGIYPNGTFAGFEQATSTDISNPTAGANYTLFAGENAASLTITLGQLPGYTVGSEITSFEIINTAPVPEPSTYALMLGGLLLLVAGRRSGRFGSGAA